jgi:hypothetical protein
MAVGDTLTVLGQHFIDSQHGSLLVRFKGYFYDDDGGASPVDLQASPELVNSGKLRWRLWPDIVFDTLERDRLGRFVGTLTVINQGLDGSVLASQPLPLVLGIEPSLIPRFARPEDAGCSGLVEHTVEDQPMAFGVEAVGLRAGTGEAPLTFRWSFLPGQWKVSFHNDVAGPDASLADGQEAVVLEERVGSGTISSVADGSSRTYVVKVLQDILGSSTLKELKTGTLPEQPGAGSMPASVHVAATDASGKTAALTIPLTIHKQVEMSYDGSVRVAERFAPALVSDCIPGQDIGRDVSYSESSHESRSRSLSFHWNVGAGINVQPGAFKKGPEGGDSNWTHFLRLECSAGFGVNMDEQVSSQHSQSLSISGRILPGEYGVFYRQTTKLYRIGQLMGTTACGQRIGLGEAILTDWRFTPDLAQGSTCVPPSGLPPAEKLLP